MGFKDIAITIIFDGAALNRDEKIGGNIQSIKKLTIGDKVVSFISRPAIRHYLFNTLIQSFKDDWKPAFITGQGTVAQFDLLQDDIFTSAELDAFGYMYTIGGENSITRKAPVGITKAISLLSYNQDMAFYANHDLVQRASSRGVALTPNPFQREENNSLYKLSFTIDSKILGEDTFIVKEKPDFVNNTLNIKLGNNVAKQIIVTHNNDEIYKINENDTSIGEIHVQQLGSGSNPGPYKVTFKLDENIKKRRICQILTAIRNGLVAHSSGEDNTIVPLFIIAAPVKVPSPIFHSYVDLTFEKGKLTLLGLSDCLKNSWLSENKVYIEDCERLKVNKDMDNNILYTDWIDFLKACGLENCEC